MITFTKEQLQQIIETDHVQCGEASALARIALASLEARSRKLFTCSACGAEGLDEPLESKCHCNEDGAHWIESVVYTAPPAPVVDADDNFYSWFGREWHEHYQQNQYTTAAKQMLGVMAESAWKAGRRAAMLQGEAEVVLKELVGWQFKSVNGDWLGLIDEYGKNQAVRDGCDVREVFAMTDSVNKRDAVREAHAEWSDATFGNVGPIGPLKHLSKEALEAAAEPDDLSEWADMQFLFWDAQRRAGISDGEITAAMEEKLKVNMARQWPEPKDGEPRLHIKAAPQQEVTQALAKGMERYGDAMQELAKREVK